MLLLAGAAAPIVARLHAQSALTAYLVSSSYDCVLCMMRHAGGTATPPGLGELAPAHCTAGGKVLLSERPRWRESLLSRPLAAYTARTITDSSVLEAQAAAARARGYASEDGEYHDGVRAVAAPVRDAAGQAIAAVAVGGDRSIDIDALSATVVRAAAAISAASGGSPVKRGNAPTLRRATPRRTTSRTGRKRRCRAETGQTRHETM